MAWAEIESARTDIAVQPSEVSQWIAVGSAVNLSIEPAEISNWMEIESARKNLSIEPGEVSDWTEIIPARTMLVVNPKGVPVCTLGETKCVGYDLYTCSVEGQWQLTKKNSEQCGYTPPPEERFPWEYIAITGGAILLIIAVTKK
jgi:hypothetical protein